MNGPDDVLYCRQTLSGRTSVPVLFRSGSRTPAHTACTGGSDDGDDDDDDDDDNEICSVCFCVNCRWTVL